MLKSLLLSLMLLFGGAEMSSFGQTRGPDIPTSEPGDRCGCPGSWYRVWEEQQNGGRLVVEQCWTDTDVITRRTVYNQIGEVMDVQCS